METLSQKANQFIEYLEETLIPDLIDSGSEETAKDFQTCIEIIRSFTNHAEEPIRRKDMEYTRESPAVTKTQKFLEALYLSYVNDYLTMKVFAEHHSIPIKAAKGMVREGKFIHQGKGCLY